MMKEQSEQLRRKLNNWEMTNLFTAFETLPLWKPLIVIARTKMASRDMAQRDTFHFQLEEYIKPLESEEYERFLGVAGDELEKLMNENQDVLLRLKEREQMGRVNYISFEEALEIHKSTIENSGGGDDGELDTGKLDSVLTHIQNNEYYPTLLDKLKHLFFCAYFIVLLMEIKESNC